MVFKNFSHWIIKDWRCCGFSWCNRGMKSKNKFRFMDFVRERIWFDPMWLLIVPYFSLKVSALQLVFVWGFMCQQNIVVAFWYLAEWIMLTLRTRIILLMYLCKFANLWSKWSIRRFGFINACYLGSSGTMIIS